MLLADQLHALATQIQTLNRRLLVWHRHDQASQRLAFIPGVGVISATALAASVTDPAAFRSGREFSAWLGLVPRQNSSGGKDKLGRISKMANRYLRKLLVVGATSLVRRARTADTAAANWVPSLLQRKPPGSSPWPWPTRPPGSSGRCWRAARPIARLPLSEDNRGAHARPRRL